MFSTFSQRPSPQAPRDPVSGQELVLAIPGGGLTALYDQMAPHSCPFFVSNFDPFSTTPPNYVWALGDSPTGKKKIFFFSFPISFFRGFDHSSFSFFPAGHPNVISSGKGTNGWPPVAAAVGERGAVHG